MKGFMMLLLVAVAAFAGYTQWQVIGLQKDVRLLEAKSARQHVTVVENRKAAQLMAQARQHCRLAQRYMDRGQTRKAKQELNLCLQELTKASSIAEDDNSGTPDLLEGWKDIKVRIDDLWKQFANGAKEHKN